MEKRREFLKKISSLTAAIMLPVHQFALGHTGNSDKWGKVLPLRKLGKTGREVTMLGVGGYHIGWTTEKDAQAVIETSLEGGIRFFDTAESYGPHTSEARYGKYLTPNYRKEIFLMTKSTARDANTMQEHLDASLERMKTDYLDLWQVHSVMDANDVDSRIAEGVFEVVTKAKEEGKVKHIGFTGHNHPAAHLRVLERTSEKPIFETIQMPINVVDANHQHFINTVLPEAIDSNLGILAMKTLADGRFFAQKSNLKKIQWETDNPVIPNRVSLKEALYFVWSLPVSVLISGAEKADFIQEKIQLAWDFGSFDQQKRESLIAKVADLALEGKVEYYKNI
ncbi:MAG: aldo/keto reductase [Cyclobacteriaceae bacterium]|nr:aldo/keto reductase [Cyclobacteriaceae bacterium]